MVLTKASIVQRREENKTELNRLGIKSISLIGSYAQEKANANSDIDFLVEFKKG
jgi:predicted nucleotidyltransferase